MGMCIRIPGTAAHSVACQTFPKCSQKYETYFSEASGFVAADDVQAIDQIPKGPTCILDGYAVIGAWGGSAKAMGI